MTVANLEKGNRRRGKEKDYRKGEWMKRRGWNNLADEGKFKARDVLK